MKLTHLFGVVAGTAVGVPLGVLDALSEKAEGVAEKSGAVKEFSEAYHMAFVDAREQAYRVCGGENPTPNERLDRVPHDVEDPVTALETATGPELIQAASQV